MYIPSNSITNPQIKITVGKLESENEIRINFTPMNIDVIDFFTIFRKIFTINPNGVEISLPKNVLRLKIKNRKIFDPSEITQPVNSKDLETIQKMLKRGNYKVQQDNFSGFSITGTIK